MSRGIIVVLVPLLFVSTGCFENRPWPVGVLEEVPAELAFVVAKESQFRVSEAPEGMAPGTEIDDIDSLNGCWGRVGSEVVYDIPNFPDGDDEIIDKTILIARVLKVDVERATLERQTLFGFEEGLGLYGGLKGLFAYKSNIESLDSKEMTERFVYGESALMSETDVVPPNIWAQLAVEISIGLRETFVFTVDGNTLLTMVTAYPDDLPEPGEEPGDPDPVLVWKRFECPH